MPIQELTNKGKVVLCKDVWQKIFWLHKNIPDKEWSAILFYETEGTLADLNNMVFTVKDLYLMDIGTAGATDFKIDPENTWSFYDEKPEYLGLTRGLIHSHVRMGTFFSRGDTENLQEVAPFHNYYLSVIVNQYGDAIAKVAFKGQIETKQSIRYTLESKEEINSESTSLKDVIYTFNCDVEIEIEPFFKERYETVLEEKAKKIEVTKGSEIFKDGKDIPTYANRFDTKNGSRVLPKYLQEELDFKDEWQEFNTDEKSKPSKAEVLNFLTKLIAIDPLTTDKLEDIIKDREDTYEYHLKIYVDNVDDVFDSFYLDCFNDITFSHLVYVVETCEEILKPMNSKLAKLISKKIIANNIIYE